MPSIKALLDRTVRSFNRMQFERTCRSVLETPPAATGNASGTDVVSMLRHTDVPMYLAALKSFARFVPVNAVHIVNDGTLQPDDRATLAVHAPGVDILNLSDFRSPHCPQGGCWERLLAICALSAQRYVVQLDADTLAIDDLDEVRDHVAAQRSFTIGTWDRQDIDTMEAANQLAKRTLTSSGSTHVQLQAEAAFDRLRDFPKLRYVRGCAGFMGFAPGSLARQHIEEISSELRDTLGPVWDAWGSEQVMANILVANTPNAAVLPHPKYCNCDRIQPGTTAFIHFVGSCRFTSPTYARHTSNVIAELDKARIA